MTAYAVAVMTASPWLGVLAASATGACFGLFHGWICKFPKVNDIAIGIALMLFGSGLAFFFGKPFIQPSAPDLPAIPSATGRAARRCRPRSTSTCCS